MARRNSRSKGAKCEDNTKMQDASVDESKKGGKRKGHNAPPANPQTASLNALVNFDWPTGNSFDLGTTPMNGKRLYTIPGIHVEYIIPSVGYAATPGDPINIASDAIYSYVRHAKGGGR